MRIGKCSRAVAVVLLWGLRERVGGGGEGGRRKRARTIRTTRARVIHRVYLDDRVVLSNHLEIFEALRLP